MSPFIVSSYVTGAHPPLHSFPTRRSSDLSSCCGPSCRYFFRPFCPRWSSRAARSEEHTSELQSRQYLVCRLLLEKKKQVRRTAGHRGRLDRLAGSRERVNESVAARDALTR